MAFTKITSTDLANKGVIGLPDVPGLSTSDMQNKLEETARSVIIPKHNALIDELEDTSAAASLGATAPSGLSGENVQALINDLNLKKENNSSSLPATNTAEGSDTFNIRKNTTTYKITFANLVASIKTAIGNATTAVSGLFSSEDKTKLDGIEANANNYSLPIASGSVLGGIKVGKHLSIDSEGVLTLEEGGEVLSVNGKTGIVTLDASDVNALPDNTPIPAKVSDLTNDSGYQTASDVSTSINTALTPYQTKNLSSSIAGQSTVEGAIGANATAIDVLNSGDSVSGSVAKTVKDAINALDKSDSAVEGSYVTAVSETNGQITVTREAADTAPTSDSNKMITSGAVYELQSAQQQLLEYKADNSIIGNVENGTTASHAYAVGSHFIRNGKFCTVTTAISADESLVGSSKFTEGDLSNLLMVEDKPATSIDVNCTVDSARNHVIRTGNVVALRVRFTLVVNQASGAILEFPFEPFTSPMYLMVQRTSDRVLMPMCYISSNKRITISALNADTYEINGTYICK